MKRICTVCGQGLGSSLIVELNVKKALEELGVSSDFEVEHKNLNSYSSNDGYEFVIVGRDLEASVDAGSGTKIVLNNILDINELKQKISEILK